MHEKRVEETSFNIVQNKILNPFFQCGLHFHMEDLIRIDDSARLATETETISGAEEMKKWRESDAWNGTDASG
eukprot:scaffold1228_cov246-Pinguiococcus_pyrenoidosus.AAC.20